MAQTQTDQATKTDLIESRIDREAAGAIALTDMGLRFANMVEIMEFAKMMAVAGAAVRPVFRNNPGACLAVTMKANFFGFEPFSFASKCYFVNDELAYESQLIHAIILAKGGLLKRPVFSFEGDGDKRKCTVVLSLPEPDGEKVYVSPEFGKILPKNSPLWKSDPDQQHIYYSLRAAARRFIPDVILGMYDLEEMGVATAREVNERPASMSVADKLKSGPALEVVYTSGKADPGKAGAAMAEHVAAAQDGRSGSVARSAAEPGESTSASPEPAGTTSQHEPLGNEDADIPDMFERTMLQEVRTELGKCTTLERLAVAEDEFKATMDLASDACKARFRELMDARAKELGGDAAGV